MWDADLLEEAQRREVQRVFGSEGEEDTSLPCSLEEETDPNPKVPYIYFNISYSDSQRCKKRRRALSGSINTIEPLERRARLDTETQVYTPPPHPTLLFTQDPLSVISHLRCEDHDMVLRAVRVGIEGGRVLNYRHVVSHEFPTPYEVDNQLLLLLLHPLSHPPGSVTRTACQPRSVLFCR